MDGKKEAVVFVQLLFLSLIYINVLQNSSLLDEKNEKGWLSNTFR